MTTPVAGLSKKQRFELLRGQLALARASFVPHWMELNDYILPRRGQFSLTDNNRGNRRSTKILDSTATQSSKTLQSGMLSGVTSPARPWKRLTTPDPALAELPSVKNWLHIVNQRMDAVFVRSNIYKELGKLYRDMAVYGTGACIVLEDAEDVIHAHTFPIGSYYLATDAKNRPRVFMREFRMTVRQLVEKFGGDPASPDWSKFSPTVRTSWQNGQAENPVDVVHVIAPNADYDATKAESKFKPFTACYYEKVGDQLLEESGFDEWPMLIGRWDVSGEDVYGTDCPGMTALPDIKQLQFGEKTAMQAIEKKVKPPMVADPAMRTTALTILPGGVSYVQDPDGKKFRQAHAVDFDIADLEGKQEYLRYRIRRAFFEDIILMLGSNPNLDSTQKTAREIEERHEEKYLVLGPVLEELSEVLGVLIDRTFGVMVRRGDIPEAPEELQGQQLKVEYISVMAQAQKRVGISGVQEVAGFALSLADARPDALDKVDFDQMIDDIGEMTGVPPRIIVSDEDVAEIRAARAEAQQAAAQAEQLELASRAAKNLATSPTEGKNALTDVLAGVAA